MNRVFIKPEYLKMLTDIFDKFCPDAEIWAYGSRIKGDAHEGSDFDLVVKSYNSENKSFFELKNLLSESNIPFFVDIHEFDKLPEYFQDEITKDYVVLYNGGLVE